MQRTKESMLPLSRRDQETASINERHAVLLRLQTLATGGGSALVRLCITGHSHHDDIAKLLKEGCKFMDTVVHDIGRYQSGVTPHQDDADISYDPQRVFVMFAENSDDGDKEISEDAKAIDGIKGMQEYISQIRDFFLKTENGDEFTKERAGEVLRMWRRISAPYIRLAMECHSEWMSAHTPPRISW